MSICILVADDSTLMRQLISSHINDSCGDYKILTAEDGAIALQIFKENTIDMLISDWNMPNMNGLELIKAIRACESNSNIPILMVTTQGSVQHIREAIVAGANQYIAKPFTEENFVHKFEKLIESEKIGQ